MDAGLFGGYKKGYENPKAFKRSGGGVSTFRVEETIEDISGYPCLAIPERGITRETAEHFGIRVKLDGQTGMRHDAHYFPYYYDGKLAGYKKRDLTKPKADKGHFTVVGFQSVACELFGMQSANTTGGKRVFITEGEYDAAVLYQTLKDKYPRGNPSVVSISNGTSNAVQNIGQKVNMKFIKRHAETVLCFDADKANEAEKQKKIMKGRDALAAVYSLMPEIKVADFPEDCDPCDMVAQGQSEQLYWAAMKPIEYVPEGFRTYAQIRNKAQELSRLGRPWPWPTMTKLTLGRREGEGYFIGAGVKMGKSEWLNQLAEHIFKVERTKVALFKFEEENAVTCKKIAGKLFHKDFTNAEKVCLPDGLGGWIDVWGNPVTPDMRGYFVQEELVKATDEVGDNIIYYSNYGRAVWEEVKGAIRHAVLVEGAKDVFIDPITRLTQGMTASEANTELERFSDEISKMAKELGFTYYCFCHLNKPETGKPHEFGGQVQSAQFAGSRAMMRNTYYMVGIERNKDPELSPKERNTSYFVILDDRKHGRAGKIPVFYDVDTGDYLEPPEGFLDSECQTLREWFNLHPESKDVTNTNALLELSPSNQENQHYADLTEDNIPAADDENREAVENFKTALGAVLGVPTDVAPKTPIPEIGQVYTGLDDENPPF